MFSPPFSLMKPQSGHRLVTPADRFPVGPAEPGAAPAPDAYASLEPAPVLLHSCCAPCSSAILEWLLARRYRPTVFFYNPNIFPREEYDVRRSECIRYCEALGVPFIDGDYEHERWREAVRGLENEPERGARCLVCFKTRMRAAALAAKSLGIECFTTPLAGRRWKRLEQIREAAEDAALLAGGVRYWDMNWKRAACRTGAAKSSSNSISSTSFGADANFRWAISLAVIPSRSRNMSAPSCRDPAATAPADNASQRKKPNKNL